MILIELLLKPKEGSCDKRLFCIHVYSDIFSIYANLEKDNTQLISFFLINIRNTTETVFYYEYAFL